MFTSLKADSHGALPPILHNTIIICFVCATCVITYKVLKQNVFCQYSEWFFFPSLFWELNDQMQLG